jgi:boron transporter
MASTTGGNLATAEVLLSTAIMGVLYAILSGQPLVIMGVTGPVAILLGTSYNLAEQFNADYFPFFAWTCIWAGLMHIVSAMLGLVALVWTVTPFTSQIFELFIAITFIYSSVQELIHPIFWGHRLDRAEDYAQLLIGFVTFYIAWTLHFAESWKYFSKQIRIILASYNTLLAVIIGTALSYVPTIDHPGNEKLLRVRVVAPWDWQPTADRNWFIDPFSGVEAKAIFAAMIPGLMFFLLFIIDHNVSSILTQSPKLKLKKPCAYHWDFFILGITFFPCALLGLPPGNGLIPQAPLHARALCRREYSIDKDGVPCEVVVHVEEQRWSGLGQALLMFVALASFRVISWIPRGCLFGLFLYLGCGALYGNAVFERFLLCFVAADKRPTKHLFRLVDWKHVQLWTLIQAICALIIFGNPLSICGKLLFNFGICKIVCYVLTRYARTDNFNSVLTLLDY